MIIKDALLEPFYIEKDYHGYQLYDTSMKNPEKKIHTTLKIEDMLVDVINRKISLDKSVVSLRDFVVKQKVMYAELQKIMDATDTPVAEPTSESSN